MSDDIAERVKKIVVEHLGVDEGKVSEKSSFIDDLGADSLDTVELVMAFEEEFGLGLVTPLGVGLDTNWSRLIDGQSGIRAVQAFDVSDLPCKIAGLVPVGETDSGAFNADDWVSPRLRRRMDQFITYGLAAATMAVEDAGWEPADEAAQRRTGVMVGSGIGGLQTIYEGSVLIHERGPRRSSPFFIPSALINLVSGHVSIRFGFKGPNHSVVTACSTGAHAIGDAARLIMLDDADVMVAGGAEAAVCRLGIAGFAAARALSTHYNDTPEKASRPWDKGRDGFVMGEGAGIVVLEEYEHAKARGANIHAEVIGYGLSGDAHHITAPAEDGDGGYRAMQAALKRARMTPADIDYINAHGTSTPLGDEIELGAVKRLFGDHAYKLSMSSTKSAIGHLLGAAGSVEAIYSILAINNCVVPPSWPPRPRADDARSAGGAAAAGGEYRHRAVEKTYQESHRALRHSADRAGNCRRDLVCRRPRLSLQPAWTSRPAGGGHRGGRAAWRGHGADRRIAARRGRGRGWRAVHPRRPLVRAPPAAAGGGICLPAAGQQPAGGGHPAIG